jgi:hypothetical protein
MIGWKGLGFGGTRREEVGFGRGKVREDIRSILMKE